MQNDPSRYLLPLDQMIENDYPIPSYMADVFEKSAGWLEVPEQPKDSLLADPSKRTKPRVYALDCEMVCGPFLIFLSIRLTSGAPVFDRVRQGAHQDLHDRL